ncbi:MAG: ribonuclease [Acidimicrobiales bacterium]|nr:ribonuclease [Acidimicrobiales bacterium]
MSDPAPELPNTPRNEPASPDGEGANKPRRRGSRGGRNRSRARNPQTDRTPEDLPERAATNRPPAEVTEKALVRKPQIGDTLPAHDEPNSAEDPSRRRRRRGGRGRGRGSRPVEATIGEAVELDSETLEKRRGRERKGRPVGRYLMAVHAHAGATQIAVLEGRSLIEHYVSRPQDDALQIHGNIYLGRVQNVLPGMEAAFVDIGTPKNAVLYRGDVQFDAEDVESGGSNARIEQILKARQSIICQVTKNPIGAKGARLTQEVSLPGRFVVLIPNSSTYGISKRLSDEERKRLRAILDKIKPAEHGLIVRTAAEGATREELERDVARLFAQWERIEAMAKKANAPTLLYREPDMAVRVIREEFNSEYRGVVIDDPVLYEEVREYVASITPELADRVELHDPAEDPLPLFETFHVHEQLHKALDRKVWLPSGGSLIIERTEALTVIDVNTGKNVGTSSLEETVFRNNLEAAEEVARQLRLRDIGGIIVIDFIDMEIKRNRDEVIRVFRDALARDKTRTQVFDISELGLVEMTRKRIGEGLIESMSSTCPVCEGRGIVFDKDLLER